MQKVTTCSANLLCCYVSYEKGMAFNFLSDFRFHCAGRWPAIHGQKPSSVRRLRRDERRCRCSLRLLPVWLCFAGRIVAVAPAPVNDEDSKHRISAHGRGLVPAPSGLPARAGRVMSEGMAALQQARNQVGSLVSQLADQLASIYSQTVVTIIWR